MEPTGDGDESLESRLRDAFWERHANPLSGLTRVLVTPVLVYALYRRKRRLLAAAVGFVIVNPVLFPRPERTDNWFSRGVVAERRWIEAGRGTMGLGYPNRLNTLAALSTLVLLWGVVRTRPVATVLGTAATMLLKLWWVDEIIRRTGVGGEPGRGNRSAVGRDADGGSEADGSAS